MGTLEKLRRMFDVPLEDVAAYQCVDCGTTFREAQDSCSECGGEVTERIEVFEYGYWPYP